MRLSTSLPLLLFAAMAAWLACMPAQAQAQTVHRCTAMDGSTILTDRRCEDLGAMDRLPDARMAAVATASNTICPRTLRDLVYRISAAINAQDANKLAGVYLWNHTSDAAANRIMDKLEAVVQRPLVDIAPIRPEPPPVVENIVENAAIADAATDETANAYLYDPPPRPVRPTGLRIEQTLRNSATPSRTVFGLRRSYGCFWIVL
ncbi:MAG: hypothetical protein QM769_02110 [Pseudoxanthomonas sp.]